MPGAIGHVLDRKAAAPVIVRALGGFSRQPVALPVRDDPPRVTVAVAAPAALAARRVRLGPARRDRPAATRDRAAALAARVDARAAHGRRDAACGSAATAADARVRASCSGRSPTGRAGRDLGGDRRRAGSGSCPAQPGVAARRPAVGGARARGRRAASPPGRAARGRSAAAERSRRRQARGDGDHRRRRDLRDDLRRRSRTASTTCSSSRTSSTAS